MPVAARTFFVLAAIGAWVALKIYSVRTGQGVLFAQVTGLIVSGGLGAMLTFAGFKLFRTYVMLLGGLFGLVLGGLIYPLLMRASASMLPVAILVHLGVVALCAWLAWSMYLLGVFLLGAKVGFFSGLLLSLLAAPRQIETALVWGGVLSLIGGVVAVNVNRVFIIIGTAMLGGLLLGAGAALLSGERNPFPIVAGVAGPLAIIGIVVQFAGDTSDETPVPETDFSGSADPEAAKLRDMFRTP